MDNNLLVDDFEIIETSGSATEAHVAHVAHVAHI